MGLMAGDGEALLAKVEAVLSPVLDAHGLELVDAQWRREGRRWALRFFVDKPGGAGIADCQRFSHEAGDVLDVSGLLTESYDLEVSSPGLDRQLRKDREFRWALGRRVRCWLAGGEEVRGRLAAVEPDRLVLERDDGRIELPRRTLTKARLDAEVPWPRKA